MRTPSSVIPRSWPALIVGPILLMACTSSTPPSTSSQPSTSPIASAVGAGGLPPGCEPIELREPTGERIVLDGEWIEVGSPDRGDLMTWWLSTQGDCVRGAGSVDEVHTEGISVSPNQVQSLSGHITSDFAITGEMIWLGPDPPGERRALVRFSPFRMLIQFDEGGRILLREDREAGVRGPRCPDPQVFCPDPLLLEQADE